MDNSKFKDYLQEYANSTSLTEKEASALALGFYPNLNKKNRFKMLESSIKSQDLKIRRASFAAIGFSALHHELKRGKEQRTILKKHLNDPLETTRITVALSLGINAFLSKDRKLQKKTYNEFRKNFEKRDSMVQQGYAVGLGLLSKNLKREDCLSVLIKAFNPIKMKNPSIFLIGLTLVSINTDKAEEGLEFIINYVIPKLTSKESRRIAVICSAFLFPLIADLDSRIEYLEMLLKGDYEFASKFGTDSALVLTHFSIKKRGESISKFQEWLSNFRDLDPDYSQIFNILQNYQNEIDILLALLKCNTLDIKAAGINASFFLESEDSIADINSFIKEGLIQRGSGSFDRFLVLLRTFSFYLMRKEYTRAQDFEPFFNSNDQRVKRFAAAFFTCLKALNYENEIDKEQIFTNLRSEIDEKVRWGVLVGFSMHNSLGKDILADELIFGLLLLCLGYIEASTSLLISQAMISNFHETVIKQV